MKRRTTHYSLLLPITLITIQLSNSPTCGFNIKRFFSRFQKQKEPTTTTPPPPPPLDPTDFQTALSLAFGPSTSSCTPSSTQTCPSPFFFNASHSYGVDISFPMHHPTVSRNYPWLPHNTDAKNHPTPSEFENVPLQILGDRMEFYEGFMRGCRERYPPGRVCDETERERIEMTRSQPRSMQNYTTLGFKKIRAPSTLMHHLTQFYTTNHPHQKTEKWPPGNIYTNHWSTPTAILPIENPSLSFGGPELQSLVWDASRRILEEWTGRSLTPTSLYGIRIYKEGSVLSPHVDRLPLVTSAIINVDQDCDEEWPLEVVGHDGRAYNVTMGVGDMVLYESHSVIHGRPFPLKGRHYANVFIHFEPTGHTLRHESQQIESDDTDDPSAAFEKSFHELSQIEEEEEEESVATLPDYIIPGTPEERRWRQQHPGGKIAVDPHSPSSKKEENNDPNTNTNDDDDDMNNMNDIDIQLALHHDAAIGDLHNLKRHARHPSASLFKADANGWTVIHEAARGGRLHVLKYLLTFAEGRKKLNDRTNEGYGGSPMWWAEHSLGGESEVVKFLKSVGGESLEPLDLEEEEKKVRLVKETGNWVGSDADAREMMKAMYGQGVLEDEINNEDDVAMRVKELMKNLEMENPEIDFSVEDVKIINLNENNNGGVVNDDMKKEIENKMKEAIKKLMKQVDTDGGVNFVKKQVDTDGGVRFVKKQLNNADDVYDDYDSDDDDDDDDDDDN